MAKTNRTTTLAFDARIIAGIQKDLQTVSSLPLAGTNYTPTSLSALVQSRIDAATKVAAARAAWLDAVASYDTLNTTVVVVVHDLKHFVMGMFGRTAVQLADFGFSPPKTATQTTEQKAVAVAKRAATREARGTKGPKARLAITGETAKAAALASQSTGAPAATPAPASAVTPLIAPPKA